MNFDDDLSYDMPTDETGVVGSDPYAWTYDYDWSGGLSNPATVEQLNEWAKTSGLPYAGNSGEFNLGRVVNALKNFGGKALDFGTTENKGMLALLGMLAGAMDKRAPSGGGTTKAYAGVANAPTRNVVAGKYGPIAKYAAQGGLMSAYARGGEIAMEDGGFVMTKRAVDGAGGIAGLKQHVPEAQPIRGPGTGTSDSIPARIHGNDGTTAPARVSNGEAYIPPGRDTQSLYALMRALERKA